MPSFLFTVVLLGCRRDVVGTAHQLVSGHIGCIVLLFCLRLENILTDNIK